MSRPGEFAGDTELWRRWRAMAAPAPALDEAERAMLLAGYAEGRLDEAQSETVEAWLAEHPEALADLAAARESEASALPPAPEGLIARASSLIALAGGTVVPFPAASPSWRGSSWRRAAAWSGIAASLLVTSLVGFELGNGAYEALSNQNTVVESSSYELLDPPGGLFLVDDEDSAT